MGLFKRKAKVVKEVRKAPVVEAPKIVKTVKASPVVAPVAPATAGLTGRELNRALRGKTVKKVSGRGK